MSVPFWIDQEYILPALSCAAYSEPCVILHKSTRKDAQTDYHFVRFDLTAEIETGHDES